MWWGDEHAKDLGRANTVMLQDATGKTPECQTSETTTYPFTDLAFTENRMTMDKDSMEEWGMAAGESRGPSSARTGPPPAAPSACPSRWSI